MLVSVFTSIIVLLLPTQLNTVVRSADSKSNLFHTCTVLSKRSPVSGKSCQCVDHKICKLHLKWRRNKESAFSTNIWHIREKYWLGCWWNCHKNKTREKSKTHAAFLHLNNFSQTFMLSIVHISHWSNFFFPSFQYLHFLFLTDAPLDLVFVPFPSLSSTAPLPLPLPAPVVYLCAQILA